MHFAKGVRFVEANLPQYFWRSFKGNPAHQGIWGIVFLFPLFPYLSPLLLSNLSSSLYQSVRRLIMEVPLHNTLFSTLVAPWNGKLQNLRNRKKTPKRRRKTVKVKRGRTLPPPCLHVLCARMGITMMVPGRGYAWKSFSWRGKSAK